MKKIFTLLSTLLTLCSIYASNDRITLSGEGWRAMLDAQAQWRNDKLYLPSELPNDLSLLDQNSPTNGWSSLDESGTAVSIPMSIDEYFSGGDNTKTYEGVSWIWRDFDAPNDWSGKLLFLDVASARMRIEVYINQKLAAYDIVEETPFSFDVTKYIKLGERNHIAVRLTNPGGRRGWLDWSNLYWGEYLFLTGSKNFSSLGEISIVAKPQIYINDIFVKNILPANEKMVEVNVEVINTSNKETKANIPINIYCEQSGEIIYKTEIKSKLKSGVNQIQRTLQLTEAKLWSTEDPNLYRADVKLKTSKYAHQESVQFGVRTFEVYAGSSGGDNYYLNGKRFIFKTAIDWGYYAPTGNYATKELAKLSVDNALDMNQNGLSFHRAIGEPSLMDYADKKGLCIYEEPGGFHPAAFRANFHNIPELRDSVGFAPEHMKEKVRRMVMRDRNHPSLIIYSLSNEDNVFHSTRREALEMINDMDNSRLIINTSGPWEDIDTPHIRPYEDSLRWDYLDRHTAYTRAPLYREDDFYQEDHRYREYDDRIYFLGEVNPVTGPDNWYKTYNDILASGKIGYDTNIYKEQHGKIGAAFKEWNLSKVGSQNIKSPEEVSMQAGRGMMYSHSRHAQSILCNNSADGYGLNGWSPGPQSEGSNMDWSSAIVDEGRNIKAPAESYTYWTRPLQISLSRKNGKYFKVGDNVEIHANLINHGMLSKGAYKLDYTITDGQGNSVEFALSESVNVEGGDCFAQSLNDVCFHISSDWCAGYITLHATLSYNGEKVADGSEQILLQNRASYHSQLSRAKIGVMKWDAAQCALQDVGIEMRDNFYSCDVILASGATHQANKLLEAAKAGTTLIIKFDESWAKYLYEQGVLTSEVTEWGGNQTTHWMGNGWGYLDHFIGYQSIANKGTIGTTAWEVPHDPLGFYPFESDHELSAYGLYMCRPWLCKVNPAANRSAEIQPTLAVTLGVIDYGKGKIILNPCYNIDEDNAFTDMLFFNMIICALNKSYRLANRL